MSKGIKRLSRAQSDEIKGEIHSGQDVTQLNFKPVKGKSL